MSDDIIRKALGMSAIEPVEQNAVVPYVSEDDQVQKPLDEDFEYVIANLKELSTQGKETLDELIRIALQSQHPRAFEVVATLMKTVADMNNDILSAHKKRNDIAPREPVHSKGHSNVTNNLFVGSTAELQNFLEQQKKNDE